MRNDDGSSAAATTACARSSPPLPPSVKNVVTCAATAPARSGGRAHDLELLLGVGREPVDRDDDRDAEQPHVLDLLLEVAEALLECGESSATGSAAAACRRHREAPGVHLERAHRRDEHAACGRRPEARHLMSKNFSAPMSAPNRPR
jgi:hypothetical protein